MPTAAWCTQSPPPRPERFGAWQHDRTRASDFVIGERYSPHEILIFADVYDTRAGGMFVIEAQGRPSAVVIKATLEAGPYPNEWLEPSKRLKYFLKAIGGTFGEHFKPNAAILENPGVPILTFVRAMEGEHFTYYGVFEYKQLHHEQNGAKWFELALSQWHLSSTPPEHRHKRATAMLL